PLEDSMVLVKPFALVVDQSEFYECRSTKRCARCDAQARPGLQCARGRVPKRAGTAVPIHGRVKRTWQPRRADDVARGRRVWKVDVGRSFCPSPRGAGPGQ